MSSSDSLRSIPSKSKEATPMKSVLKPQSLNHDLSLSVETPDKPASLGGRSRNRGFAFSVKEVRQAAETRSKEATVQIKSARRQIFSSPLKPRKPAVGGMSSRKLPEKFEVLVEFFNGLDAAIRLLKLKRSASTFANISPKIESLTDRRFSYSHLAQLKYILPEAIELKRVLKYDESTCCMKPDLHITLNLDAIEHDQELKCETKNLQLRKLFRSRLVDFVKAHPQGEAVPEDALPEPFNHSKVNLHPKREVNEVHEEAELEQSGLSLSIETSADAVEERPAVASHLSRPFRRHYKISSCEKVISASALSQIKVSTLPTNEKPISASALSQLEVSSLPTSTKKHDSDCESAVPATPIKGISSSSKETASTPIEHACTPARFMSATPASRPEKRISMMSPDDDSTRSPNKLVRRRSLKFDFLLGDDNAEENVIEKSNEDLAEEIESSDSDAEEQVENDDDEERVVDDLVETNDASDDDDILDILPQSLLQSIKEKEKKAMEDKDPAISQAKRRTQMIASLPKLFNTIHFLFQSIRRTVITKEELLHKIIAGHCNIIDRREVEEQLSLMLELVPEWISERKALTGDLLVCVNKMSAPESIRARLEDATRQELPTVS